MDPVFAWFEQVPLSIWLRETDSFFAFPTVLTVHVISLGLVAGASFAVDLRALGFLSEVPGRAMDRFVPVIWAAFALAVASGLLLVLTYPLKNLTNPLFYFKLGCVAVGLWLLVWLDRRVLLAPAGGRTAAVSTRLFAVASIGVWGAAIAAGRFLAYTCTRLMVDFGKCP